MQNLLYILLFGGPAVCQQSNKSFVPSNEDQNPMNSMTSSMEIQVCHQIARDISGEVYYPSDKTGHFFGNSQHALNSSNERSLCVVEVASTEDVSKTITIIGSSRTPFAIQSGGHTSNPGFSSTKGIHISLARLTQIHLSQDKSSVEVGLGNTWVDVYVALNGTGVNAVGGRVAGPGVGGVTLGGGGFSWLTNQYGLGCDTVISYNLVLPNGTAITVDSTTPDLFFALKGGLNRFGIVTSIVFKTFPQPDLVYAGHQVFDASAVPALTRAIQHFHENSDDPKSSAILTLYGGTDNQPVLLLFHDGAGRPAAFDPFNNFAALVSTVKDQSFASFTGSFSSVSNASDKRGAFHTMSTSGYTQKFLAAIANESFHYGQIAQEHAASVSYHIEPFMKYGKYATDSAFAHDNSPLPLNLLFFWDKEADDAFWRAIMQQSIDYLIKVATAEGISDTGMLAYPNFALHTYAGAQIYGSKNTARLRDIQFQYDPAGVMFLAGGFSF
ncbi:putative FAD-linked oxidoreductase [Beauveria bassiana]|uniref:Putative FAD-linked oxidoreductase n=1 Tax=Beauveria bassiana TaxID=176275 RepID=A0A2N6NTS9_BEABA|nr:putative FAD-linked oxidoreductase [Beauveria bassiana]